MRSIMALSGGMDSTGLLMRLLAKGHTVDCLSFDYGQKHAIELERADANVQLLAEHGIDLNHIIVDLTSVMSMFRSALTSGDIDVPEGHYEEQQMKQTVVPNRNAIFASILHGHALSVALREDCEVKVALGVHSGDHAIYPDCRPEFYLALSHAFDLGNWDSDRVCFYLPYIESDKAHILRDTIDSCSTLGLDFDTVLGNTCTSYEPDERGRASGRTGSDVERILAFHSIGKIDPIEYVDEWEIVLANALRLESEVEA